MPRPLLLAALAALAAVGCRSFEERAGLFPRLRDRLDPDPDHRMEDYRLTRMPPASVTHPTNPTYLTSGGCVPCGGGYSSPMYAGGTTLGGYAMPVTGGGYAVPMGYTGVPSYSTGPVLGTPVYPSGDGSPYRPRRDDELPQPGGYSTPGAAEMGRNVAPKPITSLPVGK